MIGRLLTWMRTDTGRVVGFTTFIGILGGAAFGMLPALDHDAMGWPSWVPYALQAIGIPGLMLGVLLILRDEFELAKYADEDLTSETQDALA